jgi:lipid A 3-O-deacylase
MGLLTGAAHAADVDSADQPTAQPYVFDPFDEIRVGAFAHNWIHDEGAPVDLSIEGLSSPLAFPGYNSSWVVGNPWVSWFFDPRINVGGMINTGGKTSYAFTGFTWRIPIYQKFFFEGELGGAVNNSPLWNEPGRVDMGCAITFRESGGFGYQFNQNWDLIASIEHVSHASFCTHTNPGLTQVGLRIGYKF